MKDKDYKYKEIADVTDTGTEKDERKIMRRASIAVILIVLVMVVILSSVVYIVELNFGKTAGTVSLVIMAVIIAGYLYRKEISDKLKRK